MSQRIKGLMLLERWVLNDAPAPSESLYQLLSQTSPENMHRTVSQYGLDPATRYPNLNLRAVTPNQVRPPAPHNVPGHLPHPQACPVTAPSG